jgi:phosphatidylglycerophosphate synthase
VIKRVVLLADESAQYVIAGLSQLDRLLRTLEECFAPALAEAKAPEVLVFWKSPNLLEQRSTRLDASHRMAGQPIDAAPGGETLLLRTSVIFRRGALARLLRSSEPSVSFVRLGAQDFPADWEALSQRAGTRSDDSAWFLETEADIPRVERELIRTTGKPSDGLVSRLLNRPISQLLSRWLVQTRVTPNQISFLVLSVLAASVWMLARGTPQGFVLGMLLFHLASVLDGCDGEVARAKFLESRLGAWLDTSVDLLGNLLVALALAVGLSRQPGLPAELRGNYLLEGILTAAGIAIGVLGIARARPAGRADFNDFGSSAIARFRLPAKLVSVLQGVVSLLRRDSYALVFVVLAVLGKPEWILHGLAIAVALHFPVIAWSLWSNARVGARLRAPDRL